jgi:hypothetical protein
VLVFEEFFADPRQGYLQVLEFLGLEDEGCTNFFAVNSAQKHRLRWIAEIHRWVVDSDSLVYRGLKALLSLVGIHPSSILARYNRKQGGKSEICEAFQRELRQNFRPDVKIAERLLGREIEAWRH